ncbi:hypothetical protein [Demequina capsici]|uniref:Uncharacterized protein n=1 Tax=Demequina capsici TaxID=3075620 RepID=A0AA96F8R9_9MICO|nr:hypothetical protein [Demequina sp. OYTSA14]WNM25644.1 hypothetical protein RN606_05705 [Demequina sp. OYTSA14]
MANDILDPGPDGDYPYLPRNPDGTLDTERVSIGVSLGRNPVTRVRIYLRHMPRLADGRPVTDIAPLPAGQTVNDLLPRKYWNGEVFSDGN